MGTQIYRQTPYLLLFQKQKIIIELLVIPSTGCSCSSFVLATSMFGAGMWISWFVSASRYLCTQLLVVHIGRDWLWSKPWARMAKPCRTEEAGMSLCLIVFVVGPVWDEIMFGWMHASEFLVYEHGPPAPCTMCESSHPSLWGKDKLRRLSRAGWRGGRNGTE